MYILRLQKSQAIEVKRFKKIIPMRGRRKKRQANYIAPLQPLTLAAFRPWEGSAGAGRVRPASCKNRVCSVKLQSFFIDVIAMFYSF